jgi:hypothetical protein
MNKILKFIWKYPSLTFTISLLLILYIVLFIIGGIWPVVGATLGSLLSVFCIMPIVDKLNELENRRQ